MAGSLRQAWDAPLGLDAPLEQLLAGVTSDELRGMLAALGVKPPGTKAQRLAALVGHHSDPEQVVSVIAKAPAAARKLLERRAEGVSEQPQFIVFGTPGPGLKPGERWALDRGLLIQDRHRYGPVRMPAEVARALRGPSWHAPFDPVPPSVRSASVTPAEVDHEASAAATAFASHAASVLSACSATTPTRLKSGGIGARELARIGKAAQADDAVVRLALETAYAAGLLGRDGDRVAPTEAYDAWAEQEPRSSSPYCFRHGGTCRTPRPRRVTRTTRRFPLSRERRPAMAACRLATGCWPQPDSFRQGRAQRSRRIWHP